jgi:5-aminopentanamidase
MMLRPAKAEMWRLRAVEILQACARRTGAGSCRPDVTGRRNDGWFSYGCTIIIRPDGTIAGRAAELVEDVAVFDLPRRPHSPPPAAALMAGSRIA